MLSAVVAVLSVAEAAERVTVGDQTEHGAGPSEKQKGRNDMCFMKGETRMWAAVAAGAVLASLALPPSAARAQQQTLLS
jgi:hypothetical protein